MRVLHVVAGLGQGGAEKQLVLLCSATSRQVEHEVVAVREEGVHARTLRDIGIPVSCLGERALYHPSILGGLARRMRLFRPDVVHCWLPSMNVMGGLAAVLSGLDRPAVIASVRNVDDWKSPLRIAADRAASRLWDRVLCNSQAGLDCARRQGIPAGKLHWVPNGVVERPISDEREREHTRARCGVPSGGILLISACRLVPQKQVGLLLPILHGLRSRFPGVRLLVCGDGPLAPSLKEQAAALGLSTEVTFTGAVDDPWPLLCASDALVMTSQREGTSNTLLEAMQAGCAIFATEAGDNAVLVGGTAGWTGAAPALSSALADALAQPEILAGYRAMARERAREFTVEKMAASTLGHYADLLRRQPEWRHGAPVLGKGE